MCVGTPMQIVKVYGIAAEATDGQRDELIDLSLTGPLPIGTWVLTHLGCARAAISAKEAQLIGAALDGLRAVMAGGGLGDAFADLDARSPELPPHLQAAHAAGKTIA